MVIGTRKSNASAHPGLILLGNQPPRRTKKEIEDDKARKKAQAMAASKDAKAKHDAIVMRIAQLEAEQGQQEDDIQRHSQRPDQSYDPPDSFGGQRSSYGKPSSSSRDEAVVGIPRKKTIYDEDDEQEGQDMLSPLASTVADNYEECAIEDAASGDDFQVDLGSENSDSSDGHDTNLVSGQVEKPHTDTTRRRVRSAVSLCPVQMSHVLSMTNRKKKRRGACCELKSVKPGITWPRARAIDLQVALRQTINARHQKTDSPQ
jgi:hypothetical protein